jgi:hypothetical protein
MQDYNDKWQTHHDDKDSNKNGDKISEESESVLDVVHVPLVCPLDDLLGVKHHVAQENQEAKIELQSTIHPSIHEIVNLPLHHLDSSCIK